MSDENLKLPSDQDISGRALGEEELLLLKEVIQSGVLNSTKGTKVSAFEKAFATLCGAKHCTALASGSAAIHAALVALNLDPLSEVITTPITDMGAITPIIYQGCVPVFADVDPFSYNVTAETIRKRITPKTQAIIVTHLFGNPCSMPAIMALAREKKIPVIEDCAQAFLAEVEGKKVGTLGDIGAFSMQQGKHLTTGEGGIVTTDNGDTARRMRLFVNKAWGYGDPNPDHYFLALNYRLTELQGAVALAQVKKLEWVVRQRQAAARRMDEHLAPICGIRIPKPPKNSTHVYWKYCVDVDKEILGFDVAELAQALKNFGIASAPRYIQKPAFRCQVLKDAVTFGGSHYPFTEKQVLAGQDEAWWRREYPGSYQALSRVLVLPWNEFYAEKHVDFIASKIKQCLADLSLVKAK
ncbi:MAG: DegT/DnrJ/EryC1/StrS family aminotransferase [Candidatus Omnitrophica bacterium]|nr:DegT/DnrJ/EryC1/StrS family aminotransferase [Candidatus Omnitrophota bacterium]